MVDHRSVHLRKREADQGGPAPFRTERSTAK